jgi:hypothetical protein
MDLINKRKKWLYDSKSINCKKKKRSSKRYVDESWYSGFYMCPPKLDPETRYSEL